MRITHVVFNPASGSYTRSSRDLILTALQRSGFKPQLLELPDEAATIAAVSRLCREEDQPLIVAVGGDGTINTVVNGMLPQRALLGVIPLGTANVLAWELGIRSIEQAVQRLATGSPRPFAVGEAVTASGTRRFLLMAGIGIDGAVVAGVRGREKQRWGKLAYLFAGLRELRQWDQRLLTISDGQRSCSCHSVIVANAAHYGGPYRLARQTDLFSRGLELVPLQLPHRRSLFAYLPQLLLPGQAVSSSGWLVQDGTICISGNKPIQLDGDPFGSGPLEIRLLPDFSRLLC